MAKRPSGKEASSSRAARATVSLDSRRGQSEDPAPAPEKSDASARGLSQAYVSALEAYVAKGGERELARAPELTREALEAGLDSSAIVAAHFDSLRASGLLEAGEDREANERRQRFLFEALGPFSVARHRHEQSKEELEHLNLTLLEHTRELEALNTELEAFNFTISHDLRTSLQAVLGFAQTLSVRYERELPSEARRFVRLIIDSARGMGELIDDLLGYAQANRAPLELQPVDVGALVHDAIDELEPQLEGRDVEVVFGDLPVVQGDPVLLRRVLVNLLSNAVKFTRRTPQARIELGSNNQNGEPVFFVRDNGVGFDMSRSDRLFRAFERLHHVDEYEGTGIGLALVERIVERHGGRIWAESAPGEGATFYFTIGDGEIARKPESAADSAG